MNNAEVITNIDLMKYIIYALLTVNGLLIYFGFKLISYYIRQLGKLEQRYSNYVELRENIKIEEVLTTLERDIKAQNYKHEQEMASTYGAITSIFEKINALDKVVPETQEKVVPKTKRNINPKNQTNKIL